jgi:tRNA-modifying protein YgfZ
MHPTPLTTIFNQAEAMWLPYVQPGMTEADASTVLVAGAFDHVDLEYASLRKAGCCGLLDLPHRGTLVVSGADRLAFLNRMITQDVKALGHWRGVRSFWLSRKGRIDADLRVLHLPAMGDEPERVLLDVDVHAAERTRKGLEAYVIADDVTIRDATSSLHRLALHGPGAAMVLARHSTPAAPPLTPVADLRPGEATMVMIAGQPVTVDRWDSTGDIGLELTVPSSHARAIYEALLAATHAGAGANTDLPHPPPPPLRPIGWHAYNIARIEAGTPMFMLDFGTDALPGETGEATLHDRVSFKKGCYLGQEVVARMHALGQPKQVIVSLRITDAHGVEGQPPRQPDAGAPIFLEPVAADAQAVGAISSSTTAPMLSGAPIALATVRTKQAAPGTKLRVLVDGSALLPAEVQGSLASWSRG